MVYDSLLDKGCQGKEEGREIKIPQPERLREDKI